MKTMMLGGLWVILCSACSGPDLNSGFTLSSRGEEVNQSLDISDLPDITCGAALPEI
jgi:hypothetical protein